MTNGITDEAIAAYAADLIDIEGRINELQDDKKGTYASVREAYGNRVAKSLKRAVALYRMDADKRTEADEIDAEAERFLSIIRSPRAPRAMRTREIIEEFDPETGEIKSTTTNGGDNETSAHPELVNPGRRKLDIRAAEGANESGHQRSPTSETNHGPTESPADTISAPYSSSASPHYEAAE